MMWLLPSRIRWFPEGTFTHFDGRNEGQAADVTFGDLVVVLFMSVVNSVDVPVAMDVVSLSVIGVVVVVRSVVYSADVVPVVDISVEVSVTMVVVSFSVVGVSTMAVVGGDGCDCGVVVRGECVVLFMSVVNSVDVPVAMDVDS